MTSTVAVLASDLDQARELASQLISRGILCVASPAPLRANDFPPQDVDLVVMDLDDSRFTPDYENLLRYLKDERHLPVIVLVEGSAVERWAVPLEVDDFTIKPVRTGELVARIRRALRQARGASRTSVMRFGELTIDTDGCQVFVGGRRMGLTFKEYELLKFLAKNPRKVLSREALLSNVWGYDYYGGERTVDVHIRRLRGKIEVGGDTFIETVRGLGYRFNGRPGREMVS